MGKLRENGFARGSQCDDKRGSCVLSARQDNRGAGCTRLNPTETAMANEHVQEDFEVFVSDSDKAFGAVRQILPHEIVVYVENAGDFIVPQSAIKAVHAQKVIVDCDKLDHRLRKAIGRAHDSEDPNI
jgi:hypothetical protein